MDSSIMNWLPVVGVFIAFTGLTLAMRRSIRADWDRLDKKLDVHAAQSAQQLDAKLDAFRAAMKSEVALQSAQLEQRLNAKLDAHAAQSAQQLDAKLDAFRAVMKIEIALQFAQLEQRLNERLDAHAAQLRQLFHEGLARQDAKMAETLRDGFSYRMERIDPKDRAAELAESYNPQEFHKGETK